MSKGRSVVVVLEDFSMRAAIGFLVVALVVMAGVRPVEAAQAWYCVCKGETKRFLASTRYCEHRMNVQMGEWCSKAQTRAVYGPHCRDKGCRLAPLN